LGRERYESLEKIVLSDPDVFPTPELLSKVLGEKIDLFHQTLEYLKIEIPEVDPEWNYYKDGRSWLLKVLSNKKTFCWIFVYEKGFKTTFYINGKYEEYIIESDLPEDLKKAYLESNGKKIRSLSVNIEKEKDIHDFKKLVKVKKKTK